MASAPCTSFLGAHLKRGFAKPPCQCAVLAGREKLRKWLPPKSQAPSETCASVSTERGPPATTPNCPQRSEKQAWWDQRWGLQHPRALLLLLGPRHGIPAARARPSKDREAEQKGAPWQGLSFHLRASPALQEGCKGLRLAPGCHTHHSQALILPARRLGGGRCDARRSAGGLRGDRERQLARVAMKQNGLVELHAAPQQLEIGLAT